MLIGRNLLNDMDVSLKDVAHRNFQELFKRFEENQNSYHTLAINKVTDALKTCYGDREISFQQLSATFRRGDLLEMLGVQQ